MKIIYILSVFVVTIGLTVAEEHNIDYDNQDSWEGECQSNTSQSPIDFGYYFYSGENLYSFVNYDRPLSGCTITNNGESIAVSCKSRFEPKIKIYRDSYKFNSFHFHWGPNNSVGSEHTINGHSLSSEMHIVHYNEKYKNMNAAKSQKDGILVLGVLFEVRQVATPVIQKLGNMVPSLQKSNTKKPITFKFSLNDIVPQLKRNKLQSYFNYAGSLTTPPCTPATFIINKYVGQISNDVLNKFRSIMNSNGQNIIRNYRNVYPKRTEVLNIF